MGAKRPKMLIPLLGRPLLYWALKNLERCPAVGCMVVVAPASHRRLFEKKIWEWNFGKVVSVVNGGKERADSARAALNAVPAGCEVLGIHDGARPFVSPLLVGRCFKSAKKFGAAILAVPSKDTIKVVGRGQTIQKTLPRDRCWSAQTPQVFRYSIARRIYQLRRNSLKKRFSKIPTDDASLAESLGVPVRIVPGSYENIKITTPNDMILAETLLKNNPWLTK